MQIRGYGEREHKQGSQKRLTEPGFRAKYDPGRGPEQHGNTCGGQRKGKGTSEKYPHFRVPKHGNVDPLETFDQPDAERYDTGEEEERSKTRPG